MSFCNVFRGKCVLFDAAFDSFFNDFSLLFHICYVRALLLIYSHTSSGLYILAHVAVVHSRMASSDAIILVEVLLKYRLFQT